jgi:hypothetical protein
MVDAEIRFRDRFSVDGIMFPRVIHWLTPGMSDREIWIEEARINPSLSLEDFQVPAQLRCGCVKVACFGNAAECGNGVDMGPQASSPARFFPARNEFMIYASCCDYFIMCGGFTHASPARRTRSHVHAFLCESSFGETK